MFSTDARAAYGHRGQLSVLELSGQVRLRHACALRPFVDEVMLHDGGDTVVIDLTHLEGIDSTGLGLIAHIGRATLERSGKKAVIVGPQKDVATCLRAACFDVLFVVLEAPPFALEVPLAEVPLTAPTASVTLKQGVLQAHRDLATLSESNLEAYRDVLAALDRHRGN